MSTEGVRAKDNLEASSFSIEMGSVVSLENTNGNRLTRMPVTRLRGFHPGWFGAVMGTAIVGIAASLNPGSVSSFAPYAKIVGQVTSVLAVVLGVILIGPYIGRMAIHRDATLRDLRNPMVGPLYGTLPGGILVISATVAAVGPSLVSAATARDIVIALDWVGIPLAFAASVLFAYLLFVRSEIVPEAVNGSWFIPPVVNIVVPMVLTPLIPGSSPSAVRGLVFGSYLFWGMGFMLYLLVLTMLYHRMVLFPLPHAGLAPSTWIGLGPLGVGTITLVKMASSGNPVFGHSDQVVALISKIGATFLWGFGVWWLSAAVVLLFHYLHQGRIPYGIGWWGFTFPVGAFTVATLVLAKAWNIEAMDWLGSALFILLVIFWLVVAIRTVVALWTGEMWGDSLG